MEVSTILNYLAASNIIAAALFVAYVVWSDHRCRRGGAYRKRY